MAKRGMWPYKVLWNDLGHLRCRSFKRRKDAKEFQRCHVGELFISDKIAGRDWV